MTKQKSKAFVIDASVARSAGSENATYPTSIECRDFLKCMLNASYGIVMSSDIYAEWSDHASRFSRKWLVQMNGRKRIIGIGDVKNDVLRKRICATVIDTDQQAAMEKDCLLLEAALASDNTIFSLDETVRSLFRNAAASINEIKAIIWVNPAVTAEMVISWLERGVPNEKERQLGYIQP